MKVFAAVVIVSAVWVLFAFVLGGCGQRKTRASSGGSSPAAWMWEEHGSVVTLGQTTTIPSDHPLARVVTAGGRSGRAL